MFNRFSNASILLGFGAIAVQTCLYTVNPGEKALIMNKLTGLQKKVINEGLHIFIPIIQSPIIYDCRMKPIDINVYTGTKDLQTVTISLRVLQEIIPEKLPEIHQLLGRQYQEQQWLNVKGFLSQDDADQLLKFREQISKQIKTTLTQKAYEFNIAVRDVSFMHLGFSLEYSKAIQQKAVQQQLAEKQKFIVLRDQQLKSAQIIKSEAEAESAKLINDAVRKFGAAQIEIKRLQAAKIIAQNLANNPKISFIPDNSNNFLKLNV